MKKFVPLLAGVLAVSVIAGCSMNDKSTIREHDSGNSFETAVADDTYVNGLSYEGEYEFTGDVDFKDTGAGSGTGVVNPSPVDPEQGRLLIRTVGITAETKDILQVKTDLETQVKALGGYIESSSMSGTGKNRDLRTLYYAVRVPADKLDSLIADVGNSCTVLSSNENSYDVTLEYVDNKSKVESLRVEYDQLLKLLSQAEDLDSIIVLQNRMSEVRYQIENYESRIRVLENQVQYATLNLTVKEVLEDTVVEPAHVPTYGEKVQKQFGEMLDNTKEFFEYLGLGIIACLPGIIFLVINAVIIIIIVSSVKKKKRKKALVSKEEALVLGGNGKPHCIGTQALAVEPVKDYKKPEYAKEVQKENPGVKHNSSGADERVGLRGKAIIHDDDRTLKTPAEDDLKDKPKKDSDKKNDKW